MTLVQQRHFSLLLGKIQILQIVINVLDLYMALLLIFLHTFQTVGIAFLYAQKLLDF
jgi:hypothetical protein